MVYETSTSLHKRKWDSSPQALAGSSIVLLSLPRRREVKEHVLINVSVLLFGTCCKELPGHAPKCRPSFGAACNVTINKDLLVSRGMLYQEPVVKCIPTSASWCSPLFFPPWPFVTAPSQQSSRSLEHDQVLCLRVLSLGSEVSVSGFK